MKPFTYQRADDVASAVAAAAATPGAAYLGGGTNLVDLMRQNVERPAALVDVSRLPARIGIGTDGRLWMGAAATNTDVAADPVVRRDFPIIAEAIVNGASGQIRNTATVGGNLLQRTRCLYFYDTGARCNKREPGSGCDAVDGHNRMHAVLGASPECVATNPSDLGVALAALDARVHLAGPAGGRTVELLDLHRLPGDTPHVETVLAPGELITAVSVPPPPAAARSAYRKVRERASYAFALVSVAALLEVRDGVVASARLALGGVAAKPWRAAVAEAVLTGAPATRATFDRAAAAALADARPLAHNGFKIPLAQRVIVSTLEELS
ncbi:FAD binding domain-containing protein [Pseudonocardia humida]|uniref:Xanthine dehydrogenase family protein subunit M n=1 Tax=Pseudonocardia humida TaxID=2800819 RepID=A0ABT1A8S2_9PSEU|nr:xanthine dehydrogenase family protein subunit M [Pseudonocardia humida]MCO1659366.1 xanthine dehydrogenase family protein subunit M [Pseudonocardia humida]